MNILRLINIFTAEYNDQNYNDVTLMPFVQGDYTYATDFHNIIRVTNQRVNHPYAHHDRPDCADIFDSIIPTGPQMTLPIDDIQRTIKTTPLVEANCCDCNGTGHVDYTFEAFDGKTYYHSARCPVCRGLGHMTGNLQHDPTYPVQIDNIILPFRSIEKIVLAAQCGQFANVSIQPVQLSSGLAIYFRFDDDIDGFISAIPDNTPSPISLSTITRKSSKK